MQMASIEEQWPKDTRSPHNLKRCWTKNSKLKNSGWGWNIEHMVLIIKITLFCGACGIVKVLMDTKFYEKQWKENSIYILCSINSSAAPAVVVHQPAWGGRLFSEVGIEKKRCDRNENWKTSQFYFWTSSNENGRGLKAQNEPDISTDSQEYYPAGVPRHKLLHRNDNFVPPAPWIRTRRRVQTGFRRKTGHSRAVYESIRKIPTGKTKQISVASQPLIWFFPPMARNGLFF